MTELFKRDWRVTLDRRQVDAPLRITFDVVKTERPEPNTARVSIYNLSEDVRRELQQLREVRLRLEVGYAESREIIFEGDIKTAASRRAPPGQVTGRESGDIVTTVNCRDGGRAYRRSRIRESFGEGTSLETVVRACARALGVGPGNVGELSRDLSLDSNERTFAEGTVLSGLTHAQLTRVLASVGLRWSIQNGQLQIIRRGSSLQATALLIESDSGLVGTPAVGAHGEVTMETLMIPDLWPGRLVTLRSVSARGTFRVRSCTYRGDSHGDQWGIDTRMAPVEVAA